MTRDRKLFSQEEWARAERDLELSPRQTEIVRYILQGHSDKQIALELGISPATVRTHMGRLFAKFGLSDRLELTVLVLAALRGRLRDDPSTP